MKKIILMAWLAVLMFFGFVGCQQKSSTDVQTETTALAPAEETAASVMKEAAPDEDETASAEKAVTATY